MALQIGKACRAVGCVEWLIGRWVVGALKELIKLAQGRGKRRRREVREGGLGSTGSSSVKRAHNRLNGVWNEREAKEPSGKVWGCLLEGFRPRYGVFLVSIGNCGRGEVAQGV